MIGLWAAVAWAGIAPPVAGARGAAPRPVLSGPEVVIDSADGFFRVHYTLEGVDRPQGDYVDGVPEAATVALATLVEARDRYVDRGWRPLVGDDGTGGTDGIDLYLQTVDINGYAHGIPVDGETARGSCWIEVDQSLGGTGDVFRSVVVHELHHCVQYRYTWAADSWIYEAQATYEQYLWNAEGALAVAVAFLWNERLAHPEWPLDTWHDRFAYAGMSFVKFWEDYAGEEGADAVALWEALEAEPDWAVAFDVAAAPLWDSFDDAFLEYSEWMAFACARDDGLHWWEDSTACAANLSVPIAEVTVGTAFDVVHEEASHTATYAEVPAGGSGDAVAITCEAPGAGERLGVRIVALSDEGVEQDSATAWVEPGQALDLRLLHALDAEGSALIVFASTGTRGVDVPCTATRVAPVPDEEDPEDPAGCSCSTASPPSLLPLLVLLGIRPRRRSSFSTRGSEGAS